MRSRDDGRGVADTKAVGRGGRLGGDIAGTSVESNAERQGQGGVLKLLQSDQASGLCSLLGR